MIQEVPHAEVAFITVGEWTFALLIAYIAIANIAAAWLSFVIFRQLGGGMISVLLASGFSFAAVAWILFNGSSQLLVEMSAEVRYVITLFGLILKATAMTLVVLGLIRYYDMLSFIKRGWRRTAQELVSTITTQPVGESDDEL